MGNQDGERAARTRSLSRTAIIAAMTALAAGATLLIKVPIPATTGYFNLGDVFVVLAGLWLGPIGGLIVGGIGPTIADAIGFPQFIPATFVTKGLEGLVVGLIGGGRDATLTRRTVAAGVGGAIVVAGYFVFEAFIYPILGRHFPIFAVTDLAAAIIEILPNCIQALIGAVGGVALSRVVTNYDVGKDGGGNGGAKEA